MTPDPDVAEQLNALAYRRKVSVKAALNSTVRAGLAVERGEGRPYHAPARPLGLRPGIDLTHALRLAAAIEDEVDVPLLPVFHSGGAMVDIADRDALYQAMEGR